MERGTIPVGEGPQATSSESPRFQELFDIIYQELKRNARHQLNGERRNHTLQTTALVHEAFLRLKSSNLTELNDENHLMALVSRVMRHILVDYARARKANKRDAGIHDNNENSGIIIDPEHDIEILDLNDALNKLQAQHPRLVKIVECRFFADMSVSETAEALSLSDRTIQRDWFRAKTYLYKIMEVGPLGKAAI